MSQSADATFLPPSSLSVTGVTSKSCGRDYGRQIDFGSRRKQKMKAIITALGVIAFAATMAVAKTGKFHAPMETGASKQTTTQWYRPLADQDRFARADDAIGG
jgi:hypothetical protein